jgi:integrase
MARSRLDAFSTMTEYIELVFDQTRTNSCSNGGTATLTSTHGFADQEISEVIAPVVQLRPGILDALVADWLSEYSNRRTRERYGYSVAVIAASVGATTPADFTAAAVAQWAASYDGANNTVRAHLTGVRTFLRWCHEAGHLPTYRDRPLQRLLRSFPPIYGKAQAHRPANRLNESGYHALLSACADGTDTGLRDELFVRLGVSGGMRVDELLRLDVAALSHAPDLAWTGKANRPRTAKAGPELTDLIARYLDRYVAQLDRPLRPTDPIFCKARHAKHSDQLAWGQPITTTAALRLLLRRRAALAGIGYMAPHDLKRTAGRMMHEARSSDGGHLFDLLDIADVLDHDNPKVTKDCYIGPLGNANKERAAALFG